MTKVPALLPAVSNGDPSQQEREDVALGMPDLSVPPKSLDSTEVQSTAPPISTPVVFHELGRKQPELHAAKKACLLLAFRYRE